MAGRRTKKEILDARSKIDEDHLELYEPWELEEAGIFYTPIFDDEDDMPEGCLACGNPDYPKCTSSCKLFDD